jgi:hypothetical protein
VLVTRVAPRELVLPGFAVALSVVLWPGTILRSTNIGNTPLEIPLTLGFLLFLWEAERRRRWRPLAIAGGLLGLCLLTKVSLQFLAPLFGLVLVRALLRERTWRAAGRALAVGLIPVLLIAPWVASNLDRYGSPTVNILGQPQLFSIKKADDGAASPVAVQPSASGTAPPGFADRVTALPGLNARLFNGVMPQEWEWHLGVWWIRAISTGLVAALALAAAALLAAGPLRRRLWFLALPALSGLAVMNVVYLLSGEDAFQLRYIYPALLPLAVAVGIGAQGALRRPRLLAGATMTATVALGAVWVYVAG